MSVKACPVEGCVLLQVGGVNILDFSYAVINGTYESSQKNKMQLQRVQAWLTRMVSLTERFSIQDRMVSG